MVSARPSKDGDEECIPEQVPARRLRNKDVARYFYKISDTVGIIETLTAGESDDIRNLLFETIEYINFVVYEVDHKTEDLEHFETWDDLRDLFAYLDMASGRRLKIDALRFMQYFARQLSMYDVEHRIIHRRPARPDAQAYVGRFFDDGVDYVDTGYYYSLARENGLITEAAVRHGHNMSKALDVVDAVEDYEDDRLSNNYPPFLLYLLHHDPDARPHRAVRPDLSLVLERGAMSIRSYHEALRADAQLPEAERAVFEHALDECGRKLLVWNTKAL